jgi:hypothetical protein
MGLERKATESWFSKSDGRLWICQSTQVSFLPEDLVLPYPAAVGLHPGWYDAEIFLRDPVRLEADAGQIAQRVTEALAAGHRVWLVDDGDARVDSPLVAALARITRLDEANSTPALRVFSLQPR